MSATGEMWRSETLNNHIRMFDMIVDSLTYFIDDYIEKRTLESLQRVGGGFQLVSISQMLISTVLYGQSLSSLLSNTSLFVELCQATFGPLRLEQGLGIAVPLWGLREQNSKRITLVKLS